jgi:hypothetical protein
MLKGRIIVWILSERIAASEIFRGPLRKETVGSWQGLVGM